MRCKDIKALESVNVSSYTPALKTIFNLSKLYSVTKWIERAKGMYSRVLSGYSTVQGPLSKWCRQLEDRLQALQVPSPELEVGQDEFTEPVAQESRRLKRKHSASRSG